MAAAAGRLKKWRFTTPTGLAAGFDAAKQLPDDPKVIGGGDIITVDTFDNFDLQFEWKIAPGGNSGVKYFVTEDREGPIAHEYQVIDDARHPDAKIGPHRATAALYDAIPAPKVVMIWST